ncbi:MAG: hypothetical protein H7Z19_08745 [Chitinophagaceae bacterium]|nr:hypothetical protein [Rubrivivax sp.]
MRIIITALVCAALVACAHPVKIAPQLILSTDRSRIVDKKVGYRITDAQRAMKVTTSGGGGDNISYYLYRDMEKGLFDTLASVFSGVYVIPETGAQDFIVANGLNFVFSPVLESDSSSRNVLMWNPTDFTLRLRATAFDASENIVWTREFTGAGRAPAGGSLSETPAAQAAALDVFKQLQQALLDEPVFRK